MKRIAPLFLMILSFLSLVPATAQERFSPLGEWDYTAYCAYYHRHPMQVAVCFITRN